METFRLILYTITLISCSAMAYRLVPSRNWLARAFGAFTIAAAINAAALLSLLLFRLFGGNPRAPVPQLVSELSAFIFAVVSVSLLLVLEHETRNGNGP